MGGILMIWLGHLLEVWGGGIDWSKYRCHLQPHVVQNGMEVQHFDKFIRKGA